MERISFFNIFPNSFYILKVSIGESESVTNKPVPYCKWFCFPDDAEAQLPTLSVRMKKSRREARWQKTRESYQCVNLINTQAAPHNEEKVDVLEPCIIHSAFLI